MTCDRTSSFCWTSRATSRRRHTTTTISTFIRTGDHDG
jgi:hypothetical protein